MPIFTEHNLGTLKSTSWILTFLRESPCLSWMYFRNAVVHWRVVALSVSALQNGTKRFSSSQQMRILRLQSKSTVITQDGWWSTGATELLIQRKRNTQSWPWKLGGMSHLEASGKLVGTLPLLPMATREPVVAQRSPDPYTFSIYFSWVSSPNQG